MTRFTTTLALATVTLAIVACSSGAATTTQPSSSPSPIPGQSSSPAPSLSLVPISTGQDAAARVVEVAPSLAGIGPKDPDLIGGCCFWEATPTADGFEVVFEVGWGDCQSGCIERHRWTYSVSRDGAVSLIGETGGPVPSGVPGNGSGSSGTGSGDGSLPGGSGIMGSVHAGPTCPVVRLNDPACDDRPIAGVTVLVLDAGGTEIARLVSDSAGHYAVNLPSGPYSIEPQPVDGMMRSAGAVAVTVGNGFLTVDLEYDTGIR